jgi:hypothetical protein
MGVPLLLVMRGITGQHALLERQQTAMYVPSSLSSSRSILNANANANTPSQLETI